MNVLTSRRKSKRDVKLSVKEKKFFSTDANQKKPDERRR